MSTEYALSVANVREVISIVHDYGLGVYRRDQAIVYITRLGFGESEAETLLDEEDKRRGDE